MNKLCDICVQYPAQENGKCESCNGMTAHLKMYLPLTKKNYLSTGFLPDNHLIAIKVDDISKNFNLKMTDKWDTSTSFVEKMKAYSDWWEEMTRLKDAIDEAYAEVLKEKELRRLKARRPGHTAKPMSITELEKKLHDKFMEVVKIKMPLND